MIDPPALLAHVESILGPRFGLLGFHPGQAQAITSVLLGRDLLAVMPTGAGKSLCFQAPAVVHDGLTLVVSPLIALMKDQVDGLRQRSIRAGYLASGQSSDERRETIQAVRRGEIDLLYASPERLRDQAFINLLARAGVWMVAVDEAHCISTWGSDFRPDYLRIPEAIGKLPRRPVIAAFTATATQRVQDDLVARLGMVDPVHVLAGFARPNLRFLVRFCRNQAFRLDELVRQVQSREGTGIVYSGTRKATEEQAAFLREHGKRALAYHAGLSSQERTRAQDTFMSGEIDVICATSAFGLGIDKPDVRFVIHTTLPPSPDAYYQEAGRAGRDGNPSDALMLYCRTDRGLQEWLINADFPDVNVLRQIHRQATKSDGRLSVDNVSQALRLGPTTVRVGLQLLAEAGTVDLGERVGNEILIEARTSSLEAQHLASLDMAINRQQRWRIEQLDAVEGYVTSDRCRRAWLLRYFGDPASIARGDASCCDRCARPGSRSAGEDDRRAKAKGIRTVKRLSPARAVLRDALIETGDIRAAARMTDREPKVMAEDARRLMAEGHIELHHLVPKDVEEGLTAACRAMDEAGVDYRRARPGYLQSAMRYCPPGTNWDHLRLYFAWKRRQEALEELADVEFGPEPEVARPVRRPASGTSWLETLGLLLSGKTIQEIVAERGFQRSTIEKHLITAVEAGRLDKRKLVDPATESIIARAIAETPASETPLRDIRARAQAIAGRDVSYLEIGAVRAGMAKPAPDPEVARLLERKDRADELRREREETGETWPPSWEAEYQRILAALKRIET